MARISWSSALPEVSDAAPDVTVSGNDAHALGILRRQVSRFLSVGVLAAAVSYAAYVALVWIGLPTVASRAIGFVAGTVLSFHGNSRFTFSRNTRGSRALLLYCILYATTLGINVAVNELGLSLLGNKSLISLTAAWFVATACSSTLNFVGMRQLIFAAPDGDR